MSNVHVNLDKNNFNKLKFGVKQDIKSCFIKVLSKQWFIVYFNSAYLTKISEKLVAIYIDIEFFPNWQYYKDYFKQNSGYYPLVNTATAMDSYHELMNLSSLGISLSPHTKIADCQNNVNITGKNNIQIADKVLLISSGGIIDLAIRSHEYYYNNITQAQLQSIITTSAARIILRDTFLFTLN